MTNQTIVLQEDYYGTFRPKVMRTVFDFLDKSFEIARIKNGVRETLLNARLSEILALEDGILNMKGGEEVNLWKLGLNQDSVEKLRGLFDTDYLAEFIHVQFTENFSLFSTESTSSSDVFSQSIASMLSNEKKVKITLFKSGIRITYPEGSNLAISAKPKVIDGVCQHFFPLDSTIGFEVVQVAGEVTTISKTKIKKEIRLGSLALFPVLPLVTLVTPTKKKAVTSELTFDEREFELRMSGKGWQFLLPLGKGETHSEDFRAEVAKAVINYSEDE